LISKKEHISPLSANARNQFIGLYQTYHKRLCLFALKFIRNQESAEDIVQEIFISLWERGYAINFDDTLQMERYLFKSVFNNCITHLKRSKSRHNHNEQVMLELMTTSADIDEHILSKELHEQIESIIQELPQKSKEIFRLSREEGLKNKEIASKLKLTEKSIEYHITKTLKHFKEKLIDYVILALFIIHFIPKN